MAAPSSPHPVADASNSGIANAKASEQLSARSDDLLVTCNIQGNHGTKNFITFDASICQLCAQFLLAVLNRELRQSLFGRFLWSWGILQTPYLIFVHRDSGKALKSSAEAGCVLCQVIFAELSYEGDDRILLGFHQPAVPNPLKFAGFLDRDDWTFSPVTKTEFLTDQDRSRTLLKRRGLDLAIAKDARQCLYLPSPTALFPKRKLPPFPLLSFGSLNRIHEWMKDCRSKHEHCNRESSHYELPKRLLDLETVASFKAASRLDPTARPIVSLKETAQINTNRGKLRYVALSYCWGGWDGLVTRKDNITEMYKSVPDQLLPQTIRDAIHICRVCKVRYLWVDALCICQDDAEDWRQESGRMADVYSGCDFVISALNSAAARDGFLRQRGFLPIKLGSIRSIKDGSRREKSLFVRYAPLDIDDEVLSAPLTTRGWALQEWMLAPAVLHFGNDQLMWECNTVCVESETGERADTCPVVIRLPDMSGPRTFGIGRQPLWEAVVEKFTRRRLSYSKDRVPAVTGLAKRLEYLKVYSGVFSAGMWENGLTRQLLWFVPESDEDMAKPESAAASAGTASGQTIGDKTAPTWSWVYCDRPVSFPLMEYHISEMKQAPRFDTLQIGALQDICAVNLKAVVQEFDLSEIFDRTSPHQYQNFRETLQLRGAVLNLDERPILAGRYLCIRICAAHWGFSYGLKDCTVHHLVVRELDLQNGGTIQGQELPPTHIYGSQTSLPDEQLQEQICLPAYTVCVRVGLLTFSRGSECVIRFTENKGSLSDSNRYEDIKLGSEQIMDILVI